MPSLLPNPRNFHFLLRQQARSYRNQFPPIEFYKRDLTPSAYTTTYGEAPEERVPSSPPLPIPAYVLLNPPKANWESWGINQERDVEIHFGRGILEEGFVPVGSPSTARSPFPEPVRGDLLMHPPSPGPNHLLYEISDLYYTEYYANNPTFWTVILCFGKRYNPSSLGDRPLAAEVLQSVTILS